MGSLVQRYQLLFTINFMSFSFNLIFSVWPKKHLDIFYVVLIQIQSQPAKTLMWSYFSTSSSEKRYLCSMRSSINDVMFFFYFFDTPFFLTKILDPLSPLKQWRHIWTTPMYNIYWYKIRPKKILRFLKCFNWRGNLLLFFYLQTNDLWKVVCFDKSPWLFSIETYFKLRANISSQSKKSSQ